MKIATSEIRNLVFEGESDNYAVVEEGEWIGGGKYEIRRIIFKPWKDDKFYAYYHSRTGSYYNDYCYGFEYGPDEIEVAEVHKVTKMVEVWE